MGERYPYDYLADAAASMLAEAGATGHINRVKYTVIDEPDFRALLMVPQDASDPTGAERVDAWFITRTEIPTQPGEPTWQTSHRIALVWYFEHATDGSSDLVVQRFLDRLRIVVGRHKCGGTAAAPNPNNEPDPWPGVVASSPLYVSAIDSPMDSLGEILCHIVQAWIDFLVVENDSEPLA